MRILHVNDVSTVGTTFVRASGNRDTMFQPVLRRSTGGGVIGFGKLALGRFSDARRIAREYRVGGFTNLHIHYASFAHLAELARLPFSLHLHGGDILIDLHLALKGGLTRLAIRRATTVVVSTPNLVTPALSLRADVQYIPNPVVIPTVEPGSRRAATPYAIMLSKMNPFKGWERQLELMRRVHHALPTLNFWFIGEGQLPTDQRRDLAEALRSLGGRPLPTLPHAEFLSLVAGADLAIGQMEVGALGMAELEAMALGVPTIADARELIQLGCEPGVIDPSEPLDSIDDLLTKASRAREAHVQRARTYVRTVHDPARSLALLERALSPTAIRRALTKV